MMNTKKYCSHAADIPTGDHFAIIDFSSISIPGDQRSIDCPGHGYPASTEYVSTYISFTDRGEWEKEINTRMTVTMFGKKEFVALKVTRAEIQTTHTVSVN